MAKGGWRSMGRVVAVVAGLALAPLWAAGTAWAGDWDICPKAGERPDAAIAACTRIIESGNESRTNRAIAYYNRGIAWAEKGQYDKAIADYTKAIRRKPDLALAYYNRGNAWLNKGQYD